MRQSTVKYSRYVERAHSEYSLGSMLLELRSEARSSWTVMHQFRKLAIAQPELSENHERCAEMMKRQLLWCLNTLNAGLSRRGSYNASYFRRVERQNARYRELVEGRA